MTFCATLSGSRPTAVCAGLGDRALGSAVRLHAHRVEHRVGAAAVGAVAQLGGTSAPVASVGFDRGDTVALGHRRRSGTGSTATTS